MSKSLKTRVRELLLDVFENAGMATNPGDLDIDVRRDCVDDVPVYVARIQWRRPNEGVVPTEHFGYGSSERLAMFAAMVAFRTNLVQGAGFMLGQIQDLQDTVDAKVFRVRRLETVAAKLPLVMRTSGLVQSVQKRKQ